MKGAPHVLVIDDELQILRALRTILTAHNYRVSVANRGEEGLSLAAAEQPDVIILDLGLPDIDGITVCARLRQWTQTPIIIEELLARLRVALRHSSLVKGSRDPVVEAGDLVIDLAGHTVSKGGVEVKLTATEFELLAYLAAHPGRVLTHQGILNHVWGPEYVDNVEYLRVYMSQLRKKLENNPKEPKFLLSEPGVGYRFSFEA